MPVQTRVGEADLERVVFMPGETHRIEIPYSEVAMHMKMAGEFHWVRIMELGGEGSGRAAASIVDVKGRPMCPAVVSHEAGVRWDQVNREWYAFRDRRAA